jgi:hypothetical protein
VSSTGRPDEVSEYAPRWLREGTAKPGNVIPLPTASQSGAEDAEEGGESREPVWRRAATPFDGDVRRWRDEPPPSIAQRPVREADVDDEPLFASPNTRIFLPARIYLSNVGRHFKATALVVVVAFVLGLTAVLLFPYALRGLQSRGQPAPAAAPLDTEASQQDADGPAPFASRFGSAEQWPKASPNTRSARTTSNATSVLQPAPTQQTVAVLQPAPAPVSVLQPAPAPVLQPAPAPAPVLQPAPAAAPVLQPAPIVQTATVSAPVETTTVTAPVAQTETITPQSSITTYAVAKSEPSARPEPQPRVEAQPVLQPAPSLETPQTQRVTRGRQALPPQPEPSESRLDPAEVGRLLSRGQAFLNQGDVSAARLALERVAEAGEARAALALGATYDPAILKRMGMVGIKADVEKARSWYERAASLGSAEANQRLMALGQFGR